MEKVPENGNGRLRVSMKDGIRIQKIELLNISDQQEFASNHPMDSMPLATCPTAFI